MVSCDPEITEPDIEPDSTILLDLGEPMTEAREFLEIQGITEDEIHAALLNYTIGFNRVAALVNSVIYADFEATDRNLLKQRTVAVIKELDAFKVICKDLEDIGTTLESALDAYEDTFSEEERRSMSRSSRAEEPDTWYARRLIEIMLDYENPVRFNLNDISRRTGVGMEKLRFFMQNTSDQLHTEMLIVDSEEYGKEIKYLETVRDTAGNINATLSLATPLGAFTGATATTAAVTTTGANAVGWLSKAKKAYTVVENSSAFVTFTDGVVNLAVDEKDIPPAFKSVAKYNSYLGIALGGASGFKNVSGGDKIVGIVGATTDTTKTFFEVKDGKVQVSEKPNSHETPTELDTMSLEGVLPGGTYKIPDVDISQWSIPEFDWGDEDLWEDLYDGTLIGDAYDVFMDGLNQQFQDLIDTWDPSENNDKTKEASVDTTMLPEFFEYEDPDEAFPDHEDVVDDPDPATFTIEVFATPSSETVPSTVTFTIVPSGTFLYGKTEFEWDFGDGTPTFTLMPGDSGYGAVVVHEYTEFPTESSFTVSVTATDPRGYSASTEKTVSIRKTLQQMIDSATGTIVNVPSGTYTEVVTVPRGLTLVGSGAESTIIEGSVLLDPDTALENLTVYGTTGGTPAIHNSYDVSTWGDEIDMDIDITNVVVECVAELGADTGIRFMYPPFFDSSEKIPYVGIITNCVVRNCNTGIYLHNFDGEIEDCILENKNYNIQIYETSEEAKIYKNEIRDAENGIRISELRGTVDDNLIEKNDLGLIVSSTYQSASISNNDFINNGPYGAIAIDKMNGGSIYHNNVTGNWYNVQIWESYKGGGGIRVGTMFSGSDISNNTIDANKGVGMYIEYLGNPANKTGYDSDNGAVVAHNTIENNIVSTIDSNTIKGGGIYIDVVYDGAVIGNTISGNSAFELGGGLYILDLYGTVSGNIFTENEASRLGGGVYINRIVASGLFVDNTVHANQVTSSTVNVSGGGIHIGSMYGSCDDNEVTNNIVSTTGPGKTAHGGGVRIDSINAGGSFSGNLVTGNNSGYDGGGVWLHNLSTGATFVDNTITSNIAATNAAGCLIEGGPSGEFDYKVSEKNTISGNILTDALENSYKDLFTPWTDDRLPADI